MEEYIVFVTFFDEISTLVLDATSEDDAVVQAKKTMVRLARERTAHWWGHTPAEVESYVQGYLNYNYRASLTSTLPKDPGDLERFARWREPCLPSGCPAGYY